MRKLLLGIILLLFTIGCSNKNKTENQIENPIIEKTAIELEDESINSGIVRDTTLLDFVFGMTKNEVANHCKKLKAENVIDNYNDQDFYYAIETKNFKKVALKIVFYYDYEDKLFRITEQPVMLNFIEKKEKSNPNVNIVEEVLNYYKNDFGTKPLTNGTQSNAKYYWLKGDKRFDYLEEDNTCVLATTKISVERKMMSYYEELERKKFEEEYLAKEKAENRQRLEEETIIEKLKAKAKRDWPEDYTTQEFWVNQQIEAYHYMLTIPNNDKIKKKAQRDWPLDFTTQQFWYNEQIDAKERLK